MLLLPNLIYSKNDFQYVTTDKFLTPPTSYISTSISANPVHLKLKLTLLILKLHTSLCIKHAYRCEFKVQQINSKRKVHVVV